MDTKELMIELSNNKTHALDIEDNKKIQEINTKLYIIKRQQIERFKAYMSSDNAYKKYLIENLEYIKSRLSLNTSVKTTVEAIKLLQQTIDMRIMFGIDYQYAEIFESEVFLKEEYFEGIEMTQNEAECSMSKIINAKDGVECIAHSIEENVALRMWTYRVSLYRAKLKSYIVSDRRTKKQLYFLKSDEETNDYSYSMYLDIIEIFEICIKCSNQYSTVKKMCHLLNIKIEYESNQKIKYENNLRLLQQDYHIKSRYPILYECLKYHIHLLQAINMEGKEHINYSSNSYRGENIFSFSNEFIGSKAVNKGNSETEFKYGKGTVNPKLTLFCLLGLLIKVPFYELPKSKRFRTFGYKKEENSYTVPVYSDEILEEAQKRVIKLRKNKIKPTRIKEDRVRKIFGKGVYKNIYGNYYNVSV